MPSRTHYEVLDVREAADVDEIQRAFRNLAKQHHPDTRGRAAAAPSDAAFQEAAEAYEVLSDPKRRRDYDASLARAELGGESRRAGHYTWENIAELRTPQSAKQRSDFDDLYDTFFGRHAAQK